MAQNRKLAGFFRQIGILFWKNGKLFKRNISGTLAEILMALLFIIILFALRYFVDIKSFTEQNDLTNPAGSILRNASLQKGGYFIYYYPPNTFIRNLVLSSIMAITYTKGNFTPLGSK
jgi:hypothetical protein